jgi:hypothetical protein
MQRIGGYCSPSIQYPDDVFNTLFGAVMMVFGYQ